MSQGSGLGSLLILLLPVLLLVFLFVSQRRRQREQQAVQRALAVGEEVSTTSGLLGRIAALDERVATLDVGSGVLLRFDRRAVAGPVAGLGPAGPADRSGPAGPPAPPADEA
ncbi:MAG TPA: preprotein translocase subunit YajC [Dermatophilaceae bacterium]|nr:preprotein translocase subunit YajC [Dermatophilaceae bacterium]